MSWIVIYVGLTTAESAGQVSRATGYLTMLWTVRVWSRVTERLRFFFTSSCPYWASIKISTGIFPLIETSVGLYGPLHSQTLWVFMTCNEGNYTFSTESDSLPTTISMRVRERHFRMLLILLYLILEMFYNNVIVYFLFQLRSTNKKFTCNENFAGKNNKVLQ